MYDMFIHSAFAGISAVFYPITKVARDWCIAGGWGELIDGSMIITCQEKLAAALEAMPGHFNTMTS